MKTLTTMTTVILLVASLLLACNKKDVIPIPALPTHWKQSGKNIGVDTTNFAFNGQLIATFTPSSQTQYSNFLYVDDMPNGTYRVAFNLTSNDWTDTYYQIPGEDYLYPLTAYSNSVSMVVSNHQLGFVFVVTSGFNSDVFVELSNVKILSYNPN